MLSVEPVRNSILRINHINDPGGVEFLTGCEDDDLVKSRHLKEEGIEAKSFNRIYPCILSIEDYLSGG
jgi:hypothetical protein